MKQPKITVVIGKDHHVSEIVGKMRRCDWDEVSTATGKDPDKEVVDAWVTTKYRWAIMLDGVVIGVFGVAETNIKEIGIPWLLGTDQMKEIKIQFVKRCRPYIDEMLERFETIMNYVDARNKDSIKLLRWCGFEIFDPVPYGVNQKPFHKFIKKRGENV